MAGRLLYWASTRRGLVLIAVLVIVFAGYGIIHHSDDASCTSATGHTASCGSPSGGTNGTGTGGVASGSSFPGKTANNKNAPSGSKQSKGTTATTKNGSTNNSTSKKSSGVQSIPSAPPQTIATDTSLAAAGAAALQLLYNNTSGSAQRGLFCNSSSIGACWWESAVELNALTDYAQQTGSTAYRSDIANTYAYAAHEAPNSTGTFLDTYYDDDGWWGLAWLNAYKLTGDTTYLTTAENIFHYIQSNGWDSSNCQGGVWQFTGSGHTKDVGANASYITLGARLYEATGDASYLNSSSGATAAANWFLNSGLISKSGATTNLVNGHQDPSTCKVSSGQKWTNYQGMPLASFASIYQATGNQTYLTTAKNIAAAALADTGNSSPPIIDGNGVLTEACQGSPYSCSVSGDPSFLQYKGVFMSGLYCLNRVASSSAYTNFIAKNASWIASTYPASGGTAWFGFSWDKYSSAGLGRATQGSALLTLIADIGTSGAMCSG